MGQLTPSTTPPEPMTASWAATSFDLPRALLAWHLLLSFFPGNRVPHPGQEMQRWQLAWNQPDAR